MIELGQLRVSKTGDLAETLLRKLTMGAIDELS
jgi:hypothetical protein